MKQTLEKFGNQMNNVQLYNSHLKWIKYSNPSKDLLLEDKYVDNVAVVWSEREIRVNRREQHSVWRGGTMT